MTATERAKEWFRKPHGVIKAVEATKIVHDLLAECERLKSKVEDAQKYCADDPANGQCKGMMRCKELEADARVMAEAVVKHHEIQQRRDIECLCFSSENCDCYDFINPCTCPACGVARKYLGGENG
jgi:hypothetical protein